MSSRECGLILYVLLLIIFGKSLKVIKINKGAIGVYNQLLVFHSQFCVVSANYNQLTAALTHNFTEKKSYAFIQKLHREIMKLTAIHEQVLELAQEFEEKYSNN